MSALFDGEQGLVLVTTRIEGPIGERFLTLALDTGATATVINVERLVAMGYDPATSKDRTQITTGSGIEYAAVLRMARLSALGKVVAEFPVIAHTLPPSAGVDGLLGLDFLRGERIAIDFVQGETSLT